MRFLLHSSLKIDELTAADYNAVPCEVWHKDTFYTANDVRFPDKAKRDREGNLVLDKNGEPIIETIITIVRTKPSKEWKENGFDHAYEIIEPTVDPDFNSGYYKTTYSNKPIASTRGYSDVGGLRGERKLKTSAYYVEFEDLKPFVDYIIKHGLEFEESPYPVHHWIDYTEDDSDECKHVLYQEWRISDY